MRLALSLLCLAVAGCAGLDVAAEDGPPLRGRIAKVVDGDTIKVELANRTETVRLIGIDTPETYGEAECGGRAASRAMRRVAKRGHGVRLALDPTQDRRDRYGRLLAYVDTLTRVDLGEAMVREGWGEVYVFDRPFRRLGPYREAARKARERRRGVWRLCDGDFDRATG